MIGLMYQGRCEQGSRSHQNSLGSRETRAVGKRELPIIIRIIRESFIWEVIFEVKLTGEISWIKVGKCILENKKSMYKKREDENLWCNQNMSQSGNGGEIYV